MTARRSARTLLLAVLVGLVTACEVPAGQQTGAARTPTRQTAPRIPTPARTQDARDPVSGLRWLSISGLPPQGQTLLGTIARGGPFRYARDGAPFGNREGILPRHSRGYYREYTVTTPGEGDRGARRIVCGGQPARSTAECYYTPDHYATFRRLRP